MIALLHHGAWGHDVSLGPFAQQIASNHRARTLAHGFNGSPHLTAARTGHNGAVRHLRIATIGEVNAAEFRLADVTADDTYLPAIEQLDGPAFFLGTALGSLHEDAVEEAIGAIPQGDPIRRFSLVVGVMIE